MRSPHIEYEEIPTGDRKNPVLTNLTHGNTDKARIFHTKENDLYHEYRVKSVMKLYIVVTCIYSRRGRIMCKATLYTLQTKA